MREIAKSQFVKQRLCREESFLANVLARKYFAITNLSQISDHILAMESVTTNVTLIPH